jgi:type II secretory ATPase GspE/PulE/Tfp pilus assembly ATPase PilB-like protein
VPESEIRKQALIGGMRPMADDGKRWVAEGKTTLEEIYRAWFQQQVMEQRQLRNSIGHRL